MIMKHVNLRGIIAVTIVLAIFVSGALLSYYESKSPADKEVRDVTSKYEPICIDGHQYWLKSRQLANRLNNDGKPVKCP